MSSREREITRIRIECQWTRVWKLRFFPLVMRFFIFWSPFVLKGMVAELEKGRGQLRLKFHNDSRWWDQVTTADIQQAVENRIAQLISQGLFEKPVTVDLFDQTITLSFGAVNGEKLTMTAVKRMHCLARVFFGRNAEHDLSRPDIHRVTQRLVGEQWLDYGDVLWHKLMFNLLPGETL